jgi:hypothetical protein
MPCEEALAVLESASTCQSLSWSMSIPLRTGRIVFHRVDQIGGTDAVDGSNDADYDDDSDDIVVDDDDIAVDDDDIVFEDDSVVVEDDNAEIDAGGCSDD